MCGIAGIVGPGLPAREELEAMADALAHRGPDDATVHTEPGLGFGFRRLAIIDPDGGRQPISNEDGSVLVVLNGEIYNFRSLRTGLVSRGHRFTTQTDTEVLVHLYEEHGADLVSHLRGMFAFALWDRPRRRLLLARDHLGQKPLFWCRNGARLLFASEIKALLAVAPERARLDRAALHEYLSLRVISSPRSMFEGISKLPSGHLMEVEADGKVEGPRRYWSLRYEPKVGWDEDEALERLDAVLEETVRLHLVSDVEVGAFLSGGLDSGLVAATIARVAGPGFKTFSAGASWGELDERPPARAMAAEFGTVHFEAEVGGDLLQRLPTLIHHLDEPSDPLGLCVDRVAELASRHVKVVLGGDGGDELFGGYDRYQGLRYASAYARIPRFLRRAVFDRIAELAPDRFWYKSLSNKIRWLGELASAPEDRRYARSLGFFYFTPGLRERIYTERFRREVGSFDPERSLVDWQSAEGVKEALDGMLLADSMVRLPNHPVMVLDRMTMAHGLEARSPFLDPVLAEFAATLPVHFKLRGHRRRYLETRLARRVLPESVLRRPKQGFASVLPYLMGDQYRALFGRFLPGSRLVDEGILDQPGIRGLVDEHLSGRRDHGARLWLLLNAELWYRLRIQGQDRETMQEEIWEALGDVQGDGGHPASGALRATASGVG